MSFESWRNAEISNIWLYCRNSHKANIDKVSVNVGLETTQKSLGHTTNRKPDSGLLALLNNNHAARYLKKTLASFSAGSVEKTSRDMIGPCAHMIALTGSGALFLVVNVCS